MVLVLVESYELEHTADNLLHMTADTAMELLIVS
jgi:hypothetical protein